MKTIKEVVDLCNEFTFRDQYNIERVIEINQVRDCVKIVSTKCTHFDETL